MDLNGKCALITGSTGGLGLAMADALARHGCAVVLHGLEASEELPSIAKSIAAKHDVPAAYEAADLRDPHAPDRLVAQALQLTGRIDILINNAVVRDFVPIEALTLAQWQDSLTVNLTAALRCTQLCLPGMRTRSWGRILNMTSVYGSRAAINRVGYVTTKAALLGLTRAVALECVDQGITCNALCPGSVKTPNIDSRIDEMMQLQQLTRADATKEFLRGKQPSARLIDAAHVAEFAVFLCSMAASQITGALLPMDGGWLAS